LELDAIEVVVIDEADRMSDMGFLPEVRRLLARTPKDRQTLLFSATLEGAVGVLTRDFQREPVRHESGGPEPDGRGAHHLFWRVEGPDRADVAAGILAVAGPTIVFCRTRRGADRLAARLGRDGVRADAIHGGRSQSQRDRALGAFTAGHVDALVATDVAARGIHVDGVACVVHFDSPEDETAYLHRSGRTARAGASGVVVSFVPHADRRAIARMQRVLDIPGTLTHPDLDALAEVVGPRVVRATTSLPVSDRTASSARPRTDRHGERRPEPAASRSRRGRDRRNAPARRRRSS
jgi:superfamily II DNA/RNA helicase